MRLINLWSNYEKTIMSSSSSVQFSSNNIHAVNNAKYHVSLENQAHLGDQFSSDQTNQSQSIFWVMDCLRFSLNISLNYFSAGIIGLSD